MSSLLAHSSFPVTKGPLFLSGSSFKKPSKQPDWSQGRGPGYKAGIFPCECNQQTHPSCSPRWKAMPWKDNQDCGLLSPGFFQRQKATLEFIRFWSVYSFKGKSPQKDLWEEPKLCSQEWAWIPALPPTYSVTLDKSLPHSVLVSVLMQWELQRLPFRTGWRWPSSCILSSSLS